MIYPASNISPAVLYMESYELFFVLEKLQIKINPEGTSAIQDILVSEDQFWAGTRSLGNMAIAR